MFPTEVLTGEERTALSGETQEVQKQKPAVPGELRAHELAPAHAPTVGTVTEFLPVTDFK